MNLSSAESLAAVSLPPWPKTLVGGVAPSPAVGGTATGRGTDPGFLAALLAVSAPLLLLEGEQIVFANPAMQQLLGYDLAQLQALRYADWVSAPCAPALRGYVESCLNAAAAAAAVAAAEPPPLFSQAPPLLKCQAVSASGAICSLEVSGQVVECQWGRLLLLTCLDISDMLYVQNRVEQILAARTAELLLSHHEMEAFLENASIGITCSRGDRLTRGNKKFIAIFELTEDIGVAGLLARQFFLDDHAYVRLGRRARLGFGKGLSVTHDMVMVTANGQSIWVQLIAYPANPERADSDIWWLVQDRSAEVLAQNELNCSFQAIQQANAHIDEAQNRLLQAEKMASLGQLAAGVAHEINNPIGFVSSNLSTLRRYVQPLLDLIAMYSALDLGGSNPALQQRITQLTRIADLDFILHDLPQLLKESEDGLSRVKKIVMDLKDFSRIDQSDWQDADLNQGLESTLNVVQHEIKYRADVRRDYGHLPPVHCLAGQLNQVFMNLIVNASQAIAATANPRGTISLRSYCAADGWVCVEVGDDGGGMSAEVQRRIFDPFFTTKPVGQGTGLGLSLSFSIVKKHGGRIELESTPGVGSVFRVWLPVQGGGMLGG